MVLNRRPRVAVIWERFGEYHHARLARVGADVELHGIEICSTDDTYDWIEASARTGYLVHRLGDLPPENHAYLRSALHSRLDEIAPDVLAVPGWSALYALYALDWATQSNKRRIVIMSDSNIHDEPRRWYKEQLKKMIIQSADAGFAAGTSSRLYLAQLGLPRERVTDGYDVVDNNHFVRPKKIPLGAGFLAVARFVQKKNLLNLIDAYAHYVQSVSVTQAVWPLTLVGSGPLSSVLERRVAELKLQDQVHFAGFRQYDELPTFYHAAGALVLPSQVEQWGLVANEAMAAGLPLIVSTSAGAAYDIARPGENALLFDPSSTEELACCMKFIASMPCKQEKMGHKSLEIIQNWDLDRFSDGLSKAVDIALNLTRTKRKWAKFAIKLAIALRHAAHHKVRIVSLISMSSSHPKKYYDRDPL